MRIDIGIQGMYLGEYYLNINNKRILPNISRDDLAREDEDEIRRQMEIAVYRHIVESVNDREVANAIEQYAKEIVHQ